MNNSNKPAGGAGLQTGIHKGWYTRGYLPHYDQGGIFQVITYRLADSLPQDYLKDLRLEFDIRGVENIDKEHREKIDSLLDQGYGSCVLKNIECAKIVEKAWQHFDGERYNLIAYVVMPNHVHILIEAYKGFELGKIVKSWKSYSGKQINEHIRVAGLKTSAPSEGNGKLWQRGYWDRFIGDDKHYIRTMDYIKSNCDNGGVLHYSTESGISN
jgi:REP-associated tyrosine transposase